MWDPVPYDGILMTEEMFDWVATCAIKYNEEQRRKEQRQKHERLVERGDALESRGESPKVSSLCSSGSSSFK